MTTSFSWEFPYPSQRMPVLAGNAVATSQPLAAQAGLRMLERGGNAVDAALAVAIALTVVEPTSNGVGADAFAIVWDGKSLHGLNASGRSPAALDPARFAGLDAMPMRGWDPVTTPGAVSAWVALWRRFGRRPFAEHFEPAVQYAREGWLVSPVTARAWVAAEKAYKDFPEFGETFLPNGRAPRPGERFRCEALARTLERIAETEGEAFYRGEIAEAIAAYARKTGGLLTKEDLAAHLAQWVEPMQQDFGGYTLHELPPNGQGLTALIALGILERRDPTRYPVDSADSLHLQIEATKLAFADARRRIADPDCLDLPPEELLKPAYLDERARLIDMKRAGAPSFGEPRRGGTVYLTAADASGMMVSYIQSNYMGFGSGRVVPGTGIALQNRGACFTLDPGHPNRVGPRKRPYQTIIPGFVTRAGRPVMSFGVMGGFMQPQGHVQMMLRIFAHGQNPQAASDAPRWFVDERGRVFVERGFAPDTLDDLRARGHHVTEELNGGRYGGAQLIMRLEAGGYLAASDHRKDGQAVGY